MTRTCNVCLEPYNRDSNPAYTCNPCGHVTCKPCLDNWFRMNRRTCPECRTHVTSTTINRPLMDLLEQSPTNNVGPPMPSPNYTARDLSPESTLSRDMLKMSRKREELIKDRCQYAVYIIDNSCSMTGCQDGKLFEYSRDCKVIYTPYVLRWEEAVCKTIQIAEYNIRRNMSASYYLLNPKSGNWVEGVDYLTIHPDQLSGNDKQEAIARLRKTLLQSSNIRGNTPLDAITCYFREKLETIVSNLSYPICYNIITDGEPNDRIQFEQQIRRLCQRYQIFLVINLCTDCESVVKYYNDLDTTIGNELSGMDVLDDLRSEADEVWSAGNRCLTYTIDLHICRMAGCYSVISDWLDEVPLDVHYVDKLIRETTGSTENFSLNRYSTDRVGYFQQVDQLNKRHPLVYDIRTNRFSPIINKYWLWYLLCKKYWEKNQTLLNLWKYICWQRLGALLVRITVLVVFYSIFIA